jgi:hypothetical protein
MDFFKFKKLLVCSSLFISSIGLAQTIVNTYDLIAPIDSLWSATTELQGTFASGNGVFTALNSGIGLGRAIGTKTQVWFLGGYNFASESGEEIYSTGFINLRSHFLVTKTAQLEAFYQKQFNSALQISDRTLVGLNLARTIKLDIYTYSVTSGVFLENETYSDESKMNILRGNLSTSITADFEDIDINMDIYYQPDVINIDDYRTLCELAFQFPIREQLVFEIESALRFDSDPHLDLVPLDFSMIIGMVYSISN